MLAAQAAAEGAGGARPAANLAATAAPMGAVVPQGGEEVSAMLTSAIMAHGAQFLAAGAVGVAQREAFAATVATSAATLHGDGSGRPGLDGPVGTGKCTGEFHRRSTPFG